MTAPRKFWPRGQQPQTADDFRWMLRDVMRRAASYVDDETVVTLASAVLKGLKAHGLCLKRQPDWHPPKPPEHDGNLLSDCQWQMIRLACRKCPRTGQYKRATVEAMVGPDHPMPGLAAALATRCERHGAYNPADACGAYLPQLAEAMERYKVARARR